MYSVDRFLYIIFYALIFNTKRHKRIAQTTRFWSWFVRKSMKNSKRQCFLFCGLSVDYLWIIIVYAMFRTRFSCSGILLFTCLWINAKFRNIYLDLHMGWSKIQWPTRLLTKFEKFPIQFSTNCKKNHKQTNVSFLLHRCY